MFDFLRSGSSVQLVCGGSPVSPDDSCKSVASADSFDSCDDISLSATVVDSPSTFAIINKHVPSLCDETQGFKPFFPLAQGDVQTIFSICANIDSPLCYDRSFIPADNGGTLALDFASSPWLVDTAPIVIVLPGLAGSSQDTYIKAAVSELSKRRDGDVNGYRMVVMNPRGAKGPGNPLTSPHLTHAGSTEDVRTVVSNVRKQYPNAQPLFALGFSMGGALLSNYLAEEGSDCPLAAAFCISTVWDLEACSKRIEDERIFRRLVYSYACGANLTSIVRAHESIFRTAKSIGLESLLARRVTRMSTFNEIFMSQLAGYADTATFATAISPIFRLSKVRCPCVMLNARDDPFYGGDCLKEVEKVIRGSDYKGLMLAVTERGGHLGWMQKNAGKLERWFPRPVREFFDGIIREGKEKI